AARLVPVPEEEVRVARALEPRIEFIAVRCERVAANRVEVARILGEAVDRREIHAAAEPPDRRGVGNAMSACAEMADVQMHDRHIRIARMQYERHAERLPCASGELRPVRSRR